MVYRPALIPRRQPGVAVDGGAFAVQIVAVGDVLDDAHHRCHQLRFRFVVGIAPQADRPSQRLRQVAAVEQAVGECPRHGDFRRAVVKPAGKERRAQGLEVVRLDAAEQHCASLETRIAEDLRRIGAGQRRDEGQQVHARGLPHLRQRLDDVAQHRLAWRALLRPHLHEQCAFAGEAKRGIRFAPIALGRRRHQQQAGRGREQQQPARGRRLAPRRGRRRRAESHGHEPHRQGGCQRVRRQQRAGAQREADHDRVQRKFHQPCGERLHGQQDVADVGAGGRCGASHDQGVTRSRRKTLAVEQPRRSAQRRAQPLVFRAGRLFGGERVHQSRECEQEHAGDDRDQPIGSRQHFPAHVRVGFEARRDLQPIGRRHAKRTAACGIVDEVHAGEHGAQLGEGHAFAHDAEDVLVRDRGFDALEEVVLGEARRQALGVQHPQFHLLAKQALKSRRRDAGNEDRPFSGNRQRLAYHIDTREDPLPHRVAEDDRRDVCRHRQSAVGCLDAKRVEEAAGHALGAQAASCRCAFAIKYNVHFLQTFNGEPPHFGRSLADLCHAGRGQALHTLREIGAPSERHVLLVGNAARQPEPNGIRNRRRHADEAEGRRKRAEQEGVLR